MDNKETLNQHNTRINLNNDELASILITINKLPTVKEEKLQDKVVEPSTTEQTITADEEYTGLGSVTVNAVTNEIDSNIVAENIKDGVEILGVTGSLASGGADFEINDCSYLFYSGARLDMMDSLLSLCKNVTTTARMFYGSFNLTELDLSGFDVSQVEDMQYMFQGCSQLTSLNLTNWNIGKVKNMNYMFQNCRGFETINLNHLDTSSVTSMAGLFRDCANLKTIDLSNWVTPKVTTTVALFNGCSQLMFIDIRNFVFNHTQYRDMFNNVPTDCLIIVKSDTEKQWIINYFPTLTNVKTVAEYEAS